MPTSVREVNTDWFKSRLADRGMSMRKLADLMDLDVGAVSLMLRGKRRIAASEAAEVARLLGVPVDEVLRHAGADVRGVVSGEMVPVVGWLDEAGRMTEGGALGPRVVSGPVVGLEGVQALRWQGGPCDGWVVFYRPVEGLSLEAVGRLCVVTTGDGWQGLRWVRRGYEAGWFNVSGFMNPGSVEAAKLERAAPVLWMRP